eukprot:6196671-Pleurochrysis_carterae.AAC.6
MSRLRPIVTGGITCARYQYGAPLYGRGATIRFASARCVLQGFVCNQRQNELTKHHAKQTVADDLQAEKEPRELSSLSTKHDVN